MRDDKLNSDTNKKEESGFWSLFSSREKIYPAKVNGKYRTLKWYLLTFFLSIYYLVPWLRWDRGDGYPDQAVLFDIAGRKVYFFFH